MTLFLVTVAPAAAREAGQSAPPDDAATLALKDLEGREQSLSNYRGQVAVLNFWATWRVPCRQEMPALVSLKDRFKGRGVQFIAASADDESSRKAVPRVARRMKISFPA
jgi:thiol-disulfide isomerase/thioredoxin